MPQVVYKFVMPGISIDNIPVETYLHQKILHTDMEDDKVTFWAEVDTDDKKVIRTYAIQGTGWELPPDREYIGTAFDGPFVWHLYDVTVCLLCGRHINKHYTWGASYSPIWHYQCQEGQPGEFKYGEVTSASRT